MDGTQVIASVANGGKQRPYLLNYLAGPQTQYVCICLGHPEDGSWVITVLFLLVWTTEELQ